MLACALLGEALLQWKYLGTGNKAGNAACVLFMFLYVMVFLVRVWRRSNFLDLNQNAETFIERGCSGLCLDGGDLPDKPASQTCQFGDILALRRNNHFHGSIANGIQNYVGR